MQAIILAAGTGSRLKELTQDNTKCMVKVNGVTLIDRMLRQLEKQNLSRIVVVVGYKAALLKAYIDELGIKTPIVYVENEIYDKTNNIYSLALAKKELCEEDTLLFESDLIFEDATIEALVNDPRDTLALVDKYERWMDGTCVKLTKEDGIAQFVPGSTFDFAEAEKYYKTVNIYKFSKEFSTSLYVPYLDDYMEKYGVNEYYEQVLRIITALDEPMIKAKRLNGQLWYEIDDEQDLDIASSMFAEKEEKAALIQSREGGYWRYPKLLDFSQPTNGYYPPQKLVDELTNSFRALLGGYPSNERVNALVMAKNFGLHAENTLFGNGVSSLATTLLQTLRGKTGVVCGLSEEYEGLFDEENSLLFTSQKARGAYGADDIIGYFNDKQIDHLIVANPDAVTGNYLSETEMQTLLSWTKERGLRLIVDETFADFAGGEASLMQWKILVKNPHVYVLKNIAQSHGVAGARIGLLVSGDTEKTLEIKRSVAAWQINSFAEYYMQIAEKYKKVYARALSFVKEERERLRRELAKISLIQVLPSQANFLTVEILGGVSAKTLSQTLLLKHGLLVKELSLRGGEYLRLAVRNEEDDNKLLAALKAELE